ncbi:hypothetical protein mRhiFer1_009912 [Rhinolophus ferrumequinum]|uniref:Uncharacterized protein n=1 Tax=Rhinolophus ferrumequinum TaxID=59479 RepID=A0A7J7YIE1_RHIFE|nr:hypothetical protein mRhiFer1_009912 [Rhinolophus ferrumequinum]
MQRGRNNVMLFLSRRAWHGVETDEAYGGGRYSAWENEVHAPSLRKTPCAVDERAALATLIWEWSMLEKARELGLDLDRGEGSILSEAIERDVETENGKSDQAMDSKPMCLECGEEHMSYSKKQDAPNHGGPFIPG